MFFVVTLKDVSVGQSRSPWFWSSLGKCNHVERLLITTLLFSIASYWIALALNQLSLLCIVCIACISKFSMSPASILLAVLLPTIYYNMTKALSWLLTRFIRACPVVCKFPYDLREWWRWEIQLVLSAGGATVTWVFCQIQLSGRYAACCMRMHPPMQCNVLYRTSYPQFQKVRWWCDFTPRTGNCWSRSFPQTIFYYYQPFPVLIGFISCDSFFIFRSSAKSEGEWIYIQKAVILYISCLVVATPCWSTSVSFSLSYDPLKHILCLSQRPILLGRKVSWDAEKIKGNLTIGCTGRQFVEAFFCPHTI